MFKRNVEKIKEGVHLDHKYVIFNFQDGFCGNWRCGYVEIKENSKFFKKDYDDIPVNCHGGLTYSGYRLNNEDFYVGFDTNHIFSDYFEHDEEFCENECKSIIEQLITLEKGGLNG